MNEGFGKKYYAFLSAGVLLLLLSTIVYAETETTDLISLLNMDAIEANIDKTQ